MQYGEPQETRQRSSSRVSENWGLTEIQRKPKSKKLKEKDTDFDSEKPNLFQKEGGCNKVWVEELSVTKRERESMLKLSFSTYHSHL